MSDTSEQRKYIAALDIGTTSLRCFIYDNNVQLIGKASDKVSVLLLFAISIDVYF